MFKFKEGAYVAVKEDNLLLGLFAGEKGMVWALYDTQPPGYEVTFRSQDGVEFDALMHEDELIEPAIYHEKAVSKSQKRLLTPVK